MRSFLSLLVSRTLGMCRANSWERGKRPRFRRGVCGKIMGMEWFLHAIGVSLVLAGIADVFLTVLHPDGFGFLSSRLYSGLFHSVRLITRPMPCTLRALGLSLAAPLMVPVTITAWIVLVLVGYATLTLAISYVVGIYGVLQQLGVTAAALLPQAEATAEPLSILRPYYP